MENEPTREQLEAALKTVGYELCQMSETALRLRPGYSDDLDQIAVNAYLECLLLHARQLAEFFVMSGRSKSTDLKRSQFGPRWKPAPRAAAANVRAHLPDLDSRLAHLTWKRVTSEPIRWKYSHIADDLVAIAFAWVDHLEQNDLELANVLRVYVLLSHNMLNP